MYSPIIDLKFLFFLKKTYVFPPPIIDLKKKYKKVKKKKKKITNCEK